MKLRQTHCIQYRVLLAVTSIVLLQACSEPPEPEAEIVRPVKLMTLGADKAGITRELSGVVTVEQSVELGFEVPGRIIELPITEGDKVEKGALLARIDPTDYLAAYNGAKSNRTAMSSAYIRAKKIFDQGAGSQAEVDITLRDFQVAREQLKTAEKALQDTKIFSPFSGEIATKIVENFENVRSKQPVLLLHDLSHLEIEVIVPEQDVARVRRGFSLRERTTRVRPEVELSAIPGQRFPAKFKSFSTAVDPVTRTYLVTLSFENTKEATVLPGMTAKVIMHSPKDDVSSVELEGFLVPVAAVAGNETGAAYAWHVDTDTMQVSKVMVELGQLSGTDIRVLNGLQEGDRIAVSGVHHLREGMKVRLLGE
ncbi:MAG: efflux RND transporter periplasmic adaptor subunit [Porticoccus sp.]|nr:efflux RND transporter periplasmic adaptor subunit [Porticoccus sp.]MBQ0807426.1 efflux RND transporter periplasmic adaptor subunit [Porticoccus sp.]